VFRVLVVDDGDVVGGRVAELCLRHHVQLRGIPASIIDVASAGLHAVEGTPLPPAVSHLLAQRGISDEGLGAHRLLLRHVLKANLIMTGTQAALDALCAAFPAAVPKAFRMTEIAELYDMVVGVAPLREHTVLLDRARMAADVGDHYDLPTHDGAAQGLSEFVEEIDRSSAWLAGVWASMAPEALAAAPTLSPGPGDAPEVAVPLQVLGVPIVVRCTGSARAALAEEVRTIWRWCARDDGAEPVVDLEACVESDPQLLASAFARHAIASPDQGSVIHYLSSTISVRAIEARAGELFMMHAAAVALDNGDVLGFVAPAGAGRTTVARVLGRHISYVTDETLAVTPQGDVVPFPKPLAIDAQDAWVHKEQWGPDALGLIPPPPTLRLSHLFILERDPDAESEPSEVAVDASEALELVAAQCSYLTSMPDGRERLAALLATVHVSQLRYHEALSLLPFVLSRSASKPEVVG